MTAIPLHNSLMQTVHDFMRRKEAAQLALEGLASRYGDDYRFYRAVNHYYEAMFEYDPSTVTDGLCYLGYSDNDAAYLIRHIEPAFIKLVLVYDEYLTYKRDKG